MTLIDHLFPKLGSGTVETVAARAVAVPVVAMYGVGYAVATSICPREKRVVPVATPMSPGLKTMVGVTVLAVVPPVEIRSASVPTVTLTEQSWATAPVNAAPVSGVQATPALVARLTTEHQHPEADVAPRMITVAVPVPLALDATMDAAITVDAGVEATA